MNIAKRISLALALPVVIVTAIAVVSWWQVARVVSESEFMTDTVAPSFVALSHFSHAINLVEDVVLLEVLDDEAAVHAQRHAEFAAAVEDGRASLGRYRVADPEDARQLAAVALAFGQWIAAAEDAMTTVGRGDRAAAMRALMGEVAAREADLQGALDEIVAFNEVLSRRAGAAEHAAAHVAEQRQVVLVLGVLLLSIALGLVVVRTIVGPLRALTATVIAVAQGDYERVVPYRARTDETGALARSLETLKLAAAEIAQQRQVKAWLARAIASLQAATTKEALGANVLELLFAAVPVGRARVFVVEEDGTTLRQLAARPAGPGADTAPVQQSVRERRALTQRS